MTTPQGRAQSGDDPEERARLTKVFEQGLKKVIGYVLPLRRTVAFDRPGWETGPWFVRREHLFLIPGDSPMGYRLPLDSLPWEVPFERQFMDERDPFAPRPPLPPRAPGSALPPRPPLSTLRPIWRTTILPTR